MLRELQQRLPVSGDELDGHCLQLVALTGQLATGRWVHTCSDPTKIPALSGLFEWDEQLNKAIPIRLHTISVGANHAAAVMDNVASVVTSAKPAKLTDNDTNWGRDILFWGNNEFYQIGSGKRNNLASPAYIQPLDLKAESERAASAIVSESERRRESGFGKVREREIGGGVCSYFHFFSFSRATSFLSFPFSFF